MEGYSRKLVEFCCSKVLANMCSKLQEMIDNGDFIRFAFDMMLAWETPSSTEEETQKESLAKEKEEKKVNTEMPCEQDDIPLFYSDLLPFLGLIKQLGRLVPYLQEVLTWERPVCTSIFVLTTLIVIYTEWVGKAIATLLIGTVATMTWARRRGNVQDKANKIIIYTGSDQTTMESIVLAQHGLRNVYDLIQSMNIVLLKIWSMFVSKAPKHADLVMAAMVCAALILAVVRFKFILMALTLCLFITTSKIWKYMENEKVNRRIKEWWDSIPVVPLEFVEKIVDS